MSIMIRDLNAIAPLITMFFLVTYAMICGVLILEQKLNMVSFRPLFSVPIWVSVLGLVGAVVSMVIINPTLTIVSAVVTFGFYMFLTQRTIEAPFEDVRSGLFKTMAEWAAQKVHELPDMDRRTWKPMLLVPLESGRDLPASADFLRDLTYPNGSISLVQYTDDWTRHQSDRRVEDIAEEFRDKGLFTTTAKIEGNSFHERIKLSLPMSRGLLGPNSLFLNLAERSGRDDELRKVVQKARYFSLGIYLYLGPQNPSTPGESVNVWVSDMSPDWNPRSKPVSLDISLLTSYKLQENWNANVRVLCGVSETEQVDPGRRFLRNFLHQARLSESELMVEQGSFDEILGRSPSADLEIFGLSEDFEDFTFMRELRGQLGSPCLFVEGTGEEDALA